MAKRIDVLPGTVKEGSALARLTTGLTALTRAIKRSLRQLIMKRTVTIYIDDTSLKLLVTEDNEVTKCTSLPLEPDLIKDGVIVDKKRVSSLIKELLSAQRIKTKKIIIGSSGLHCLFRLIALPKLPKAMLAEGITWEAKRALPVPLEEFYVQWQIMPSKNQEIPVFLVAMPRNATDALIETIRETGIKPHLMDLAPLALARLADRKTALVIDVRSTEMDIVVMIEGIIQLIRTISLPRKAISLHEKLPRIREEIKRTIKFYSSSRPDHSVEPGLPLLVTGELAKEPEVCQSLEQELNSPVSLICPPIACPEELNPSQYMANIGLVLRTLPPGKKSNFSLVNLNVLPEIHRPKPITLTQVLIPVGTAALIFAIIFVGRMVNSAYADVASLQSNVDAANQLLTIRQEKMQEQKKELTELQKQLEDLGISSGTFEGILDDFKMQQEQVDTDIETVLTLPSETSLTLTGITYKIDEMTVRGISPDEPGVLIYVDNLIESDEFSQVLISAMTRTEKGVEFTLTLTPSEME